MCRSGTAARPARNRQVQALYGAALYRAGRYEQAKEVLDEVRDRLSPGPHSFFLILTYHALGHHPTARQWYNELISDLDKGRRDSPQTAAETPRPWFQRLPLELIRQEAAAVTPAGP